MTTEDVKIAARSAATWCDRLTVSGADQHRPVFADFTDIITMATKATTRSMSCGSVPSVTSMSMLSLRGLQHRRLKNAHVMAAQSSANAPRSDDGQARS